MFYNILRVFLEAQYSIKCVPKLVNKSKTRICKISSCFPLPSGLLIYGCYGVWHSTLELDAREQQAHASSYRRYDDNLDDTFSPDDDLYPQEKDERPYQGWSAPEESRHRHQNQGQEEEPYESQGEDDGDLQGYQSGAGVQNPTRGSRSRGRTNFGFDDEDD